MQCQEEEGEEKREVKKERQRKGKLAWRMMDDSLGKFGRGDHGTPKESVGSGWNRFVSNSPNRNGIQKTVLVLFCRMTTRPDP